MIFLVVICKKNVLLLRSKSANLQAIELIQNSTRPILTSLGLAERTVTGNCACVMLHVFDFLTATFQFLRSMSEYFTYVPQITMKKILWQAILWYRFSRVCAISCSVSAILWVFYQGLCFERPTDVEVLRGIGPRVQEKAA